MYQLLISDYIKEVRRKNVFLHKILIKMNIVLCIVFFLITTPGRSSGDCFFYVLEQYNLEKKEALFMARSIGYKADSKTIKRIYDYAVRFNLDYEQLLRWVNMESRFDTIAVSCKGAEGILQLMPSTSEYLMCLMEVDFDKFRLTRQEEVRILERDLNMFSLDDNLLIACIYISDLKKCSANDREAIAKYYAGKNYVYYLYDSYVDYIY